MQPLSPDDLLIRQTPVQGNQWIDGSVSDGEEVKPAIPLERFQALEHVIRDFPLHPNPYLELSKIYLSSSRWNDAKRVLDLAVERFPEHEELSFLREESQIARSLQLYCVAEQEYQLEPTSITQERLDRCRVELNVLREKICNSRLQRHPERWELYLPLATALENLGKTGEAIRFLSKAAQEPKLRAEAALQLGATFERAGKIPEALSAYRRAALFRVPPPTTAIRLQALNAAADLAERSNMIDSARRYVELLSTDAPHDQSLQARLNHLRSTPL